jgi:hypothetical protein
MIDNKFEIGQRVYFIYTRYEDSYPTLEQGIISIIRITESGIEYDIDGGYYSYIECCLYGSLEEAFDAYKEKIKSRLEANKE